MRCVLCRRKFLIVTNNPPNLNYGKFPTEGGSQKEESKMNILHEIIKIYNKYSEEYDVFGVFLYGSQNYGLETEKSDLDLKVIIMPKLKDVVYNSKK